MAVVSFVQRMSAGKTPKDAITGTSFFVFCPLRITSMALGLFVVCRDGGFPLTGLGADATLPGLEIVNNDREMAYPMLARYLLPEGLRGSWSQGWGQPLCQPSIHT